MTDETSNLPAVKAPLTNYQLALLAREIAINIRKRPDVLADYQLSEEEYLEYAKLPFFKNALDAAIIEWNSALSTHQRIKVEAAAALEDALPVLASRMSNRAEGLKDAIDAGKLFAKLAEIGEHSTSSVPGDKFSITINLGDDKKLTFTKDVTPSPNLVEKDKNESPEDSTL